MMLPEKEFLQQCFRKSFADDTLAVTDVSICEEEEGERIGIASQVDNYDVHVRRGSSNDVVSKVTVFCKRQEDHPDLGRPSPMSNEQFRKETSFYKTLLPELIKFCENTDVDLKKLVPRFFYCDTDESGHQTVAMENVKEAGYDVQMTFFSPTKHDVTHGKKALQAIATFHAVSYAMERKQGFKLKEKYDFLEEGYRYEKQLEDMMYNVIPFASDFLMDENETEMANQLRLLQPHAWSIFLDYLKERGKFDVFAHCDFHCGNIMFRDKDGDCCDALLIDWQAIAYCSLAADVVEYILICTKPEDTPEFLRHYYDSFKNVLTAFHMEDTMFTFDEFMQEYKDFDMWLMLHEMIFVACSPFVSTPEGMEKFKNSGEANMFRYFNKTCNNLSISNMVPTSAKQELLEMILKHKDTVKKTAAVFA